MTTGRTELLIALVLAVSLVFQLLKGTISLSANFTKIDRRIDPGIYWAIIVGTAVVMIALVIDGSFSRL